MIRHTSPLSWPVGWPTTMPGTRKSGGFQVTYEEAANQLANELERLGADDGFISTDQPVRISGTPDRTRQPATPGVAVYFERKGKQLCIPCDRFNSVRDNIRAVGLTLESVRRMERYGTSQMIEAALSGFAALPSGDPKDYYSPPSNVKIENNTFLKHWWDILGVNKDAPRTVVRAAYRALAQQYHPDKGGSPGAWDELQKAYNESGAAS